MFAWTLLFKKIYHVYEMHLRNAMLGDEISLCVSSRNILFNNLYFQRIFLPSLISIKVSFFILIGNFFLIFKLSVRREVQPTVTFSPFNGLSLSPQIVYWAERMTGAGGWRWKKDEKTENSSKKIYFEFCSEFIAA